MKPLVTLLSGPAAAGKTTLARQLETQGAVRLSMDEATWSAGYENRFPPTEVLEALYETLQRRLAVAVDEERDVVVDLSLSTRQTRDAWRAAARAAGAECELVYVTAPLEVLQRRVAAREGQWDANAFRMRPEALADYVAEFEVPGPDEPHRTVTTG